jgi:hypothetical protein
MIYNIGSFRAQIRQFSPADTEKKMATYKLFNKDITPACEYCELGENSSDGSMVMCQRNGTVSPYFRCSKFKYSPIRRVPRQSPKLPKMNPEDFSL